MRKKILSNIGEDLLSVAADQPFRFPAEFTFVVRAFSVLDGVGKSLDPRFDISEIARPYAEDLLGLSKEGAAGEVLKRDVVKRWQRQNEAFVNLFQGPDKVRLVVCVGVCVCVREREREFVCVRGCTRAHAHAADARAHAFLPDQISVMADTIARMEAGDLKLRVRDVGSERAFVRVAAMQDLQVKAMLAASLVNVWVALKTAAAEALYQQAAFAAGCVFGLLTLVSPQRG